MIKYITVFTGAGRKKKRRTMVNLYGMNIKELPDARDHPAVLQRISRNRRSRVMEYLQADDRKRCLGAGILLADILPLYGENPEKITLGPMGKPEAEKIYFNISHSGDWVICAVSGEIVGCDIERIGQEPDGVAQRFFHPNEAAYLQRFQGEVRNEMFFRLWTWKESYMKMTGEGAHLSLRDFEILPVGEQIRVRRGQEALSCRIMEYNLIGYKVSVCARETAFADCITHVYYDRAREDNF